MKKFALVVGICLLVLASVECRKHENRRNSESHTKSRESEDRQLTAMGENGTTVLQDVKAKLTDCLGAMDFPLQLQESANNENNTQLNGMMLGKAIDALPQGRDVTEDATASLTSCFTQARRSRRSRQVKDFMECALEEVLDDCESSDSKNESSRKKRPSSKRSRRVSRRRN